MDLNSRINSWWARGTTKRKTVQPTTEKVSLHGENQPTICLICDQNFKGVKQCLEHLQILHGLQSTIENDHYQIRGHSEEDSTFPVQEVKVDVQRKKVTIDGTSKPKPKVATTHEKAKRPRKFIPHNDPLGLQTGLFPTEYIEEVTKLVREDEILVPTPQMKVKANQEVTFNAAPQNVIELHRRLVNGTNQLFDVPKSIPAMIRSPYMQQAHGPNDTCIFCKKGMHKYQTFCQTLKKLQPQEIRKFMMDYNIECEMCLGINHTTEQCRWSKMCNKKTNGTDCGAKHCGYLHQKEEKRQQDTPSSEREKMKRRTARMSTGGQTREELEEKCLMPIGGSIAPKPKPLTACPSCALAREPCSQEYGITNFKEYFDKQLDSSDSE